MCDRKAVALALAALLVSIIGAGWPAPASARTSEPASATVAQIAEWVAASGDNRGLPFVIIDKVAAEVVVFAADGRLRGAAPALLGLARGDDSAPGVGDRPLASIGPHERTTPAGAERLARRVFDAGLAHTILVVPIAQERATMHLDTVCTMVDVDAVLMYPNVASTLSAYTVIAGPDGTVDQTATDALRTKLRAERPALELFNYGPAVEQLRADCVADTGLPAPIQPKWAVLEAAE